MEKKYYYGRYNQVIVYAKKERGISLEIETEVGVFLKYYPLCLYGNGISLKRKTIHKVIKTFGWGANSIIREELTLEVSRGYVKRILQGINDSLMYPCFELNCKDRKGKIIIVKDKYGKRVNTSEEIIENGDALRLHIDKKLLLTRAEKTEKIKITEDNKIKFLEEGTNKPLSLNKYGPLPISNYVPKPLWG